MEANIFSVGIIAMATLAGVSAWNSPDMLRSIIGRLLARVAYMEAGRDAAAIELARWAAMQGEVKSNA
jgi:Co/Zn/Cd efflux system component